MIISDKKRNLFIGIGIVLVVAALIFMYIISDDSNDKLVVVNQFSMAEIDGDWTDISNKSEVFSKYRFKVYEDNKYKGLYEMNFVNNHWYYFDKNNDSERLSGTVVANYKKDKISIIDFKVQNLTPEDLEYIIKNTDIPENNIYECDINNVYNNNKLVYDFDNDGKEETIYSLNNSENGDNDYISVLLYKKGQKIEEIKYANGSTESGYFYYPSALYKDRRNKVTAFISVGEDLNPDSNYIMILSFDKKGYKIEKEKMEKAINYRLKVEDYFSLTIIIIIGTIIIGGVSIYLYIKKRKEVNNKL